MELIFNVGLGVFMLTLFLLTKTFKTESVEGDVLGSSGFPRLLTLVGLLLVVLLIVSQARSRGEERKKQSILTVKTSHGKTMIALIGVFTLYIGLMDFMGYVLSTLLFALSSGRLLGYKRIVYLWVFAIILTFVFVLLFGKVFFVPLPRGVGLLRELSYYLY